MKWPSEIPTDVELTNEVKVTVPSILAQHKNYGKAYSTKSSSPAAAAETKTYS